MCMNMLRVLPSKFYNAITKQNGAKIEQLLKRSKQKAASFCSLKYLMAQSTIKSLRKMEVTDSTTSFWFRKCTIGSMFSSRSISRSYCLIT